MGDTQVADPRGEQASLTLAPFVEGRVVRLHNGGGVECGFPVANDVDHLDNLIARAEVFTLPRLLEV